ncbi:diadenylate cyclase domain-containing protein [Psychrobacillus sp. OK032]|uniref:diadenylate cyclase domain-containing protein n=1 Tax=Psychrobacillus sp. OK032 TaxID=1884358 RepID=UPI0008AA8046|nr:diadenylate cyclase domain-containing protein [Psychrobacillus sp. OK032]SES38399.1 DisA checkpoint controller nucleotide-binding [Psychrobacillus sp. OK032]
MVLGNENYCLLGKLEEIKEKFIQIESVAASFYLDCYLSAFTDKYVELSNCVQRLSDRRYGALIVVQRHDPLDSLIQKGTAVGGTLTPALLEIIFYPGTPNYFSILNFHQIFTKSNMCLHIYSLFLKCI